jgi:hypothetical protein
MSTHINDDIYNVVLDQINDGVYALLGCQEQLNDCWKAWLFTQGYTGDLNDMMYDYLIDYGYTGQYDDMLKRWWEDGAPGLAEDATYTADSDVIKADTDLITADAY